MVGEFLKRADKFLLNQDFSAAEVVVKQALEQEPRNVYALAYLERINVLRLEYKRKQKLEEEKRQQEEILRKKREEENLSDADDTATAPPVSKEVLEQYKETLYEAWRDGALTTHEKSMVENRRRSLNISHNHHLRLEQEVKMNCYVQAIKSASQQGSISPVRAIALEELRTKFNVSLEEHLAAEGRILWELQRKSRSARIMVIDDEVDFLNLLRVGLGGEGYSVVTAGSPEEALEKLENVVPDLILCDIHFSNSDLDGFSLYKKLRKRREFVTLPFIFVTGLKDEWVVQEGLQVGADAYITKPFTLTTLIAAVEGRLQRYEELKNR